MIGFGQEHAALQVCGATRAGAEGAEGKAGRRASGASVKGLMKEAGEDLATLLRHPVYVCTILGQTLYTGAAPQKQPAHAHGLQPLAQLLLVPPLGGRPDEVWDAGSVNRGTERALGCWAALGIDAAL